MKLPEGKASLISWYFMDSYYVYVFFYDMERNLQWRNDDGMQNGGHYLWKNPVYQIDLMDNLLEGHTKTRKL